MTTSQLLYYFYLSFICLLQLTEEKLGTSEKTELDAHFENLAERSDITKQWTEKILRDTEAVLTPNPGRKLPVIFHLTCNIS